MSENVKVSPDGLRRGDTFTHRGIEYEVLSVSRGAFATWDVRAIRRSAEVVNVDYRQEVTVLSRAVPDTDRGV